MAANGAANGPLRRRRTLSWQAGHLAVLQWLLGTVRPKLADGAKATGYSPWHVCRIVNSPEFRRRYEEITTEQLREAVRAKWARRSLPEA